MPKSTTTWNPPHELPDSDITVLLRTPDEDNPVWPGYHDGSAWRWANGGRVYSPIGIFRTLVRGILRCPMCQSFRIRP